MPIGDGAPVRATVKWFNTAKGFGFVTPTDGSPEAFLHLSALRQAGLETVGEGASMTVEIGQSPKGRQVTRVIDVDAGSAPSPSAYGRPRPAAPRHAPPSTDGAQSVEGVVKWFSAMKGYGFVAPHSGGKDVFLHITVLRNAGIPTLAPGQPVRMQVVTASKGPEAVSVELLGPAPDEGADDGA